MSYFSVILPTYNRAHLLPKAIESVIGQTFTDWELIVVDDGSTDNTKELVESYTEHRIKYIYQPNQERSVARNNGIENAKGDYICFLDSDDYFLDEKLANLHRYVEQSLNKQVIFYDGISFERESTIKSLELPIQKNSESIFEFLLMNPLGCMQICANTKIFKNNKFDSSFRIGEDIELWLRLANNYPFVPLKNSYFTVAVEHEDRSINFKSGNYSLEHLRLIRFLYNSPNSATKFSRQIKKSVLSICYFNIGKYYMFSNEKAKAINWITRSLFVNFKDTQSKHKLFCLLYLIRGKIPKEYNS